ncbi:MAG: type II toxin-antitoxin system RelE/ParE family toxin [Gemmatimonadaceae bacterium]|nr:type II toxin-antitoxin system RelE/ParE family toxin [Caulobacter sp.]
MKVEISAAARRDIQYLRRWLAGRSPDTAKRASQTIVVAIASLNQFPERGLSVRGDLRELIVPFGSAGSVLRYGIVADRVTIARVFHSLERR